LQETQEKQYTVSLEYRDAHGQERLGLMLNQAWFDDPRRLTFTFSRYKFVSKMFEGMENVLEVGCGDGFASRIVQQSVKNLTLTDFDQHFINDIRERELPEWKFKNIIQHDLILGGAVAGTYDGIYSLDVLEHIQPADEFVFLKNIISSLAEHGTLIMGMPTLESQVYASPISKAGHVNCQSVPQLKTTMQQFFHNVYMFSMNDEVVHTGYHKMSHYVFALCCSKKDLT
jgi:2-polyprenyl-3-methyl-5-hydroxy-6-metoxy-1,4-benzoquinol methylase